MRTVVQGIRTEFCKACDFPEIVERLHRVLDESGIDPEGFCDRVPDASFAYTDPEFFHHDPGEIPAFERVGVPQKVTDREQFLTLGFLSLHVGYGNKVGINRDEIEFFVEERSLRFYREKFLDRTAHIAGGVYLLDDLLFFYSRDVADRIYEKIRADTEFPCTPVGKDPAHDKTNEDREFIFGKPGEHLADEIDHLEARGDPFEFLARPGKFHKEHGVIAFDVARTDGLRL